MIPTAPRGATANGMPESKPYLYRGRPWPAIPDQDTRAPAAPRAAEPRPARVRAVHWDWRPGRVAACLVRSPASRLTGDLAQVTCGNCRKTTVFLEALGAAIGAVQ